MLWELHMFVLRDCRDTYDVTAKLWVIKQPRDISIFWEIRKEVIKMDTEALFRRKFPWARKFLGRNFLRPSSVTPPEAQLNFRTQRATATFVDIFSTYCNLLMAVNLNK